MTDPILRTIIEPTDDGARLDVVLARELECSRRRARTLLDAGAVRVDGRPVDERAKGRALVAGQRVEVAVGPAAMERLVPAPDASLSILAAGDGWIAVDKPPGVPVHPLRPDERDTLSQRVVARQPGMDGVGEGGLRSGVVHRLDVDTSGCQLFATEAATFDRLRRAFREHRVEKTYRALVDGRPPDEGDVTRGLLVARHRPARVRAYAPDEGPAGTRACRTRWRRLETGAGNGSPVSLVEVRPVSGFLHQVRVTFADLGHPLLGDAVYGDGAGAARHMLHASALRVDEIEVAAADPPDFADALRRMRGATD